MDSKPGPLRRFGRLSMPLELGATVVGLLVLRYFTDISFVAIAGAGIGMGAATLWQSVRRRYGVNTGWGKLPPALGLLALGAYSFTYPDGVAVLKAGFVLAGGWLVLDGIYDLGTGIGATARGSPNPVEQFGDAAIVGRTLDDEPRSLAELDDTLDLTRIRIENALDTLESADAVAERDGQYHAAFADRGLAEALRGAPSRFSDRLNGIPARLVRPFRLFSN